ACELRYRLREEHWLSEVPAPVIGVELRARKAVARDGRVERHSGAAGSYPLKGGAELRQERIHLRAMRRIIDVDPPRVYARVLELGEEFVHRGWIPGDHGGARATGPRDCN